MPDYYLVRRTSAQESMNQPTRTVRYEGDPVIQSKRVEFIDSTGGEIDGDVITRTIPSKTTTRNIGPQTQTKTSDGITSTRNNGQRNSTRNIGQRSRTQNVGQRSGTTTNTEDIGINLSFRLELKTQQPLAAIA